MVNDLGFTPYFPKYPLSQFIDCLWSMVGQTHYLREKVLPTGCIDLIINLGSPHKVIDKTNYQKFELYKDSWICGLQREYIVIEAVAESNMVGIRFKPGGAYAFLQFPILELNNQVIDMGLVWGHLIDELREQLFEATTLPSKFAVLEKILMKRLVTDTYGLRSVRWAVDEIVHLDHFTSVRQLSDELGLSQKHLISQFNKFVGISPKLFSRVVRFNKALNSIDPLQPVNWAAIASHCHYYDQAHFNKDFAAFSGLNPSAYLELRHKFFGNILLQGQDVNFVPIE